MTTIRSRRAGGRHLPEATPAPATPASAVPRGMAGWPGGGEGAPPFSLAAATSQASAPGGGTGEGKLQSRLPGAENNPAIVGTYTPSVIAAGMTERQLEDGIRRILKDLPSLLWYHTHDSRRSPSGFPDLVTVGPWGILYRELKKEKGRLTKAQQEWLNALSSAGANAGVWRPNALLSGQIARELAAIAGIGGAA